MNEAIQQHIAIYRTEGGAAQRTRADRTILVRYLADAIMDECSVELKCGPEDVAGVASCIERLRIDGELCTGCKRNLGRIRRELCWERERTAPGCTYLEAVKSCA